MTFEADRPGGGRCAAGVDDRAGVQAEIRAIGAGDYLHAKRASPTKQMATDNDPE